ncbi:alcohol dehydrogenase catalytic domain-containing protein [bacterium]|nr:alcohol dehydrogenase catalytic domain-containing protein [bacterium]
MRLAIIPAPGRLELQSRPVPVPAEDQVLIRVAVCGVCSSDLAVWRGRLPKPYPYSPGHELVGRVERSGSRVTAFQTGQSVVVNPNLGGGACRRCQEGRPNLCDRLKTRTVKSNGGFAEFVALDARMVYPLPEDLGETAAVFVEPLSCALHAARVAAETRPARVVVFGAGVLGILVALALNEPGREVVLVEPNDTRRARAHELLGLTTVAPDQLAGWEADGAIDCSGRPEAVASALGILRQAGRLVLAGLVRDSPATTLPFRDITTRELEIRGVWLNPHTFEDAIALARKHQATLAALQTAVFALADVAAAFERASQPDLHKVLVKP